MSILFAAGEDEALPLLNGSVNTGGTAYRTSYARCALKASGTPGILWSFSGALATYLAGQSSGDKDFWFGYRWVGGGGFVIGGISLQMFDSSGTPKEFFRLRGAGASDQQVQLSTDGFSSNLTNYPSSTIAQPSTPTEYVFRVKIHPSDGRIDWYINGALWFSTGALDTTAFCTGSPSKVQFGGANSNGDSYFSEVRASSADDPCVGWNISTLVPTADGASTAWAGGYASISEVTKDTSTIVSTASAGNDETYVASDMAALTGTQVVRGIVLSGEWRAAASAPQHVKGLLRISGTSYPATQQTAPAVAGNLQFIWETSPATATTFTEAEVNAAEIGMRSAA